MGSSPTGGVVSSPGLHNFFSCFTVLSRGCPSAKKKTSHLDTTLLLPPLPRCRQRFASAYQPPAIFRSCSWTQLFFCRHFLGAGNASRPPTSRHLFSVPALHPGNRHRGDSSPCGQSPMDFESIAARTQCLLPARTHHASWDTDSFLLVSHLSSHCGSHWFTVLSHLQLVSSMAKKQASQSPKNIPKHKLVGPSAQNSSVCKCGHIYREHKGNK